MELFCARQSFQAPVKVGGVLQPVHGPLEPGAPIQDQGPVVEQQGVLVAVVFQHKPCHFVRERVQEPGAFGRCHPACGDHAVDEDLDVDLMVRAVHPGRIVDRIGVEQDAAQGGFNPAELGDAEIAALGNDPGPDLIAVDPDGVVCLVAHLAVRFGGRLDVRPDAAVVDEVHRRAQDGLQQLGRSHHRRRAREPERRNYRGGDGDGLCVARIHAAARADQRGVVVRPGRSRQHEQAAAFSQRAGRVRSRVQEDVPVVEGCHEPDVV